MWHLLGHPESIASACWPTYDAAVARAEEVVVPVQVNGKVRARLIVPATTSDDQLRELALADGVVQNHIAGRAILRVVVAKGPLVNIVLDTKDTKDH
jgi:leucyl-tRNA synthetase